MEIESLEEKIWKIAFWIAFAVFVGMVIWYIIGDSPTIEQAILGFVLVLSVKTSTQLASTRSAIKVENRWVRKELEEIKRSVVK